jgi:hypothetical protein
MPITRRGGVPAVVATVWDAATKSARITLSGGNLTATGDGIAWGSARSTTSKTAKRGFKVTPATASLVGIGFSNAAQDLSSPGSTGSTTNSVLWVGNGDVYYNNAVLASLTGFAIGNPLWAEYDPATDVAEFFKDTGGGFVSCGSVSAPGIGATFFASFSLTDALSVVADFNVAGPGGTAKWDS